MGDINPQQKMKNVGAIISINLDDLALLIREIVNDENSNTLLSRVSEISNASTAEQDERTKKPTEIRTQNSSSQSSGEVDNATLTSRVLKNAGLLAPGDTAFELAMRSDFISIDSDIHVTSDDAYLVVKLLYYIQERQLVSIEREDLREQVIAFFSREGRKGNIPFNKRTVENIFVDSRDNKALPKLHFILGKLERLAANKEEMKQDLRVLFPKRFDAKTSASSSGERFPVQRPMHKPMMK